MLSFQQPWWLLLLLLLPLLIIWHRQWGRYQEAAVRFSALSLFDPALRRSAGRRVAWLRGGRLLIVALLAVAMARPQITDVVRETTVEIIDIIMVLDISSSMLAADFKPNRLEAAKAVAEQFILDRPHDRIGIVVFAAVPYIQCPLTHDTNVLQSLLQQVTIIGKDHDGTAIGMAIASAINRLRDSEAESKVMILLSDGSNNAGELDPTTAAQLAAEFDIRIYTIGAGSRGRAPYPVSDPVWGQRMVNVEVDLDEATLRKVAEITGGIYFRATDQASLADVYRQINELERTEVEVREYRNIEELYGWLVIPATLIGLILPAFGGGLFRKGLA